MWEVQTNPSSNLVALYGWKADLVAQALLTLLRNAKARAKTKGTLFCIDYCDLEDMYLAQEGLCYYSGREMELSRDPDRASIRSRLIMSLDRADPKIGYTPENVRLCCCDTNIAKCDFTADEFIQMCKAVGSIHK